MYLVFTRLPGGNYRRRLRSLLLCLCDVRTSFERHLVSLFVDGTISSFFFFVLFRGPVSAVHTRDRLQGSSEPTNRSYSSSL